MASTLTIPPVFDPSTLTIPVQIFAPPITPYGDSGTNFVYTGAAWDSDTPGSCCPGAVFEDLAIHDAVTGWWAIISFADYALENDPESGDPDCGVAIAQAEADAFAASNPTLARLFDIWALTAAGFDPATPADIDGWTLFCEPLSTVPFVLPSKPPPPPTCPPGQARNAQGVCVPADPPVPAGLRNLTGPTVARNPTLAGSPTPFAMKGCGCGEEDGTEIDYASSAAPSPATSSVPTNSRAQVVGRRASNLSRLGNRTRILARALPLPSGGQQRNRLNSSGPPSFGRDS